MATIFQFRCPGCAYDLEPSGEPAVLMIDRRRRDSGVGTFARSRW